MHFYLRKNHRNDILLRILLFKTIDITALSWYNTIVSSGQGVIPYRQYSLRAFWLIRFDPGADGIVRMKEDECVFAHNYDLTPPFMRGLLL